MISSKHMNGQIRVKCGGCPERLVLELLSITNTVILAVSKANRNSKSPVIGGTDGNLYCIETLDALGGILVDAITDKASPVWEGVFN